LSQTSRYATEQQDRKQLGTPGRAKSFLRGAQMFWTMSNGFKICSAHFSRGGKKFFASWLRACWAVDITAEISSVVVAQHTDWIAGLVLCHWRSNKKLILAQFCLTAAHLCFHH